MQPSGKDWLEWQADEDRALLLLERTATICPNLLALSKPLGSRAQQCLGGWSEREDPHCLPDAHCLK